MLRMPTRARGAIPDWRADMAINGRQYDWEDISVALPSGVAVGITEIKYTDGQGAEARYGKGAIPRGYGRTNYEDRKSVV